MAVTSDRLDLKLSTADKEILIQAATIEGLSLAAFVRSAAKKQAAEAILRERQLQLSQRDFDAFQAATINATVSARSDPSKPGLAG